MDIPPLDVDIPPLDVDILQLDVDSPPRDAHRPQGVQSPPHDVHIPAQRVDQRQLGAIEPRPRTQYFKTYSLIPNTNKTHDTAILEAVIEHMTAHQVKI